MNKISLPFETLECKKCRMVFKDRQTWANHFKKFCSDNNVYGSYEGLAKREKELKFTLNKAFDNLSISNMKHYLKGVPDKKKLRNPDLDMSTNTVDPGMNQYIDQMSLDNIRGHFHSTYDRHADITKEQLRTKESELIREIKMRKEKRKKENELRSINNRIFGELALEYPNLKHKPATKDLQRIGEGIENCLVKDKRRELEKCFVDRESSLLQEKQNRLDVYSYAQEFIQEDQGKKRFDSKSTDARKANVERIIKQNTRQGSEAKECRNNGRL
ncbi:unnamed protein product [Moneuplotes crassus]|uniref:Uncharacterized protein n=1 Tax=Euplotes crassus TaxID=5936 RepID=A0AAD1XIW1_EUPCR|nr:unnamed protein product [Moneuplotes crassus]